MKQAYVLAIDQSTQGTKAILFDALGQIFARADVPHRQIINERGWVEHDLNEIGRNILIAAKRVIAESGIDKADVRAIGVTNQRESVGVWDRRTGEPVFHSIVWQCNRAAALCERLTEADAAYLAETTGLKLSPFFSGPKIAWILENVPGVRERAERGELACGTMDCWTIFTLTCGRVHKTDLSNASRMQLINLRAGAWDEGACRIFRIPMQMLPEIADSDALYGETDLDGFLDTLIPIHAAIGDSNAALFAQGCHNRGDCMTGYGTGNCVMMNLGDTPVWSKQGILTSAAWRAQGKTRYMFDGVINYAGAVITWIVKDLGLAGSPAETEEMASVANPADRTYLIPYFTGVGAPRWSNRANAVFTGMTRLTGRAELVRAALESIAYQTADAIFAMSEDAGVRPACMRVSGGPTRNRYLMQFQSDLMECDVLAPSNGEMSAQGTAQMAGIAAGVYDASVVHEDETAMRYTPEMDPARRRECLEGWNCAAEAAIRM